MNFPLNADIHAKLGYNQRFFHAPNNPFGKHLSMDTIHAPTDGLKSGNFQGRLGISPKSGTVLLYRSNCGVNDPSGFFIFFSLLAYLDVSILYLCGFTMHTVKVDIFHVHIFF